MGHPFSILTNRKLKQEQLRLNKPGQYYSVWGQPSCLESESSNMSLVVSTKKNCYGHTDRQTHTHTVTKRLLERGGPR